MAAQVICSILLSAPIFSNEDLSFEDATSQAMEPYSSFEKKMWWEVADLSQQKDYDFEKYEGKLNSDKDSKILRNELEESLNILTKLLTSRLDVLLSNTAVEDKELLQKQRQQMFELMYKLLSFDFYAGLLGLFNLNNASVKLRNPLRDYFLDVDSLEEGDEKRKLIRDLVPIVKALLNRKTELKEKAKLEKKKKKAVIVKRKKSQIMKWPKTKMFLSGL